MARTIHHPGYTRARLRHTAERMRELVHAETHAPDLVLASGPVGYLTLEEAATLEYRPATVGMELGSPWQTFWFRVAATIPENWAGGRVDLLWETGSESTLWLGGRALQGLNTGAECPRPDATILERADAGERVELVIETACSGAFGRRDSPVTGVALRRCDLCRFDREAWDLWLDYSTLQELEADAEGVDPAWAGHLLGVLNSVCNLWDADDRSTWAEARAILAELYEHRNGTFAHAITAIGHAHIDTAWWWPLAETYRKCVRTFATQIQLMDRYPDYRFSCSQAQQYAWIKERNPELFEQIRHRVERGQWLPVGGSWIEPDCNIPSGEALVRQLLVGQRFFEAEFGRRCIEAWLPDTFGFNGQLPQILRGAGMSRFLTKKLSDNQFTQLPHHTFVWQGIDGSEVVTHFPPADTYNSEATVGELRWSARNFKDHARAGESVLLFGFGDGGGGPTPRMLETLERARDLQGVPRTRMDTVDRFFERLEARADDLPRIVGELYYQRHRGTYTSQARTKQANRRCEQLLHDAEFLCAVADRLGLAPYPAEELAEAWRRQLTNAFHDILPGSSIGEVYEDAARDYAWVSSTCEQLMESALGAISQPVSSPLPVNTVGFERHEVVRDPSGSPVFVDCPPYGIGEIAKATDRVQLHSAADLVLENGQLRVVLSAGGDLLSLMEKTTGQEALAAAGNRLELYDDRPIEEDAWDVDPFHLETGQVCAAADSLEVLAAGPLSAEVSFERSIGKQSSLRQTMRLSAHSRRLEFHTIVEWHEEHALLKVAFPTVVSAPAATYEIPFGVVERPTHHSTPQDLARYEVSGHRFVDFSDAGFGVGVLTDCKYGYSVYDGTMRVSLLRSPREPDPRADVGTHSFSYALVPHAGGWPAARVAAEAATFNAPLLWTPGAAEPGSYASVEGGLVLDTIKRAEDEDGLVLRLYEPYGSRGRARLTLALPAERATHCNLLEDRVGEPSSLRDGKLDLEYRPFEIITLRID
jgi:alpha-mannosidase